MSIEVAVVLLAFHSFLRIATNIDHRHQYLREIGAHFVCLLAFILAVLVVRHYHVLLSNTNLPVSKLLNDVPDVWLQMAFACHYYCLGSAVTVDGLIYL